MEALRQRPDDRVLSVQLPKLLELRRMAGQSRPLSRDLGAKVEAARAAVRGLTGAIPVFEKDGKLFRPTRGERSAAVQSV